MISILLDFRLLFSSIVRSSLTKVKFALSSEQVWLSRLRNIMYLKIVNRIKKNQLSSIFSIFLYLHPPRQNTYSRHFFGLPLHFSGLPIRWTAKSLQTHCVNFKNRVKKCSMISPNLMNFPLLYISFIHLYLIDSKGQSSILCTVYLPCTLYKYPLFKAPIYYIEDKKTVLFQPPIYTE